MPTSLLEFHANGSPESSTCGHRLDVWRRGVISHQEVGGPGSPSPRALLNCCKATELPAGSFLFIDDLRQLAEETRVGTGCCGYDRPLRNNRLD